MDQIIKEYIEHYPYYISIYVLLNISIFINIFFIYKESKLRKYAKSLVFLLQSFISNLSMLLFSILNVVVLNQYVNVTYYFNMQNAYLAFNFIGLLLFIISLILFLVNYFKNKKLMFANY